MPGHSIQQASSHNPSPVKPPTVNHKEYARQQKAELALNLKLSWQDGQRVPLLHSRPSAWVTHMWTSKAAKT
jgi:hypothetical protein